MEKLPEPFGWKVPKLLLYRDDVAEVIRVFERTAESVDIEVDNYRLDSPSELEALPVEATSRLTIRSRNPSVSLDLGGLSGRLSAAPSDGAAARGLADEVRSVLLRKRDRLRSAAVMLGYAGPGVAFFALLGAILESGERGLNRTAAALFAASFCMSAFTYWAVRETGKYHVRIILKGRSQAPSFFRRNGDTIAVAVIMAIIATVLTKVFG